VIRVDSDLEAQREPGGSLSDADRQVLAFVAGQSWVPLNQVQFLLRLDDVAEAAGRVSALVAGGLLCEGPRFRDRLRAYQITRRGPDAIGSELPPPRIDLRRYWRDLFAGWLWLGARDEAFGPIDRVYSRREMQAFDHRWAAREPIEVAGFSPEVRARVLDAAFGVRVFGVRVGGGEAGLPERRHYPDLVIVLTQGRIAFELELEPTPPDRLREILAAYRAKESVWVVAFWLEDMSLRGPVAAAERVGMSERVRYRRISEASGSERHYWARQAEIDPTRSDDVSG
jgi:hypothetical protein